MAFNWIDLVLGGLILWSLIKGFRKGFIIELASLLALILGIYGAIKFADITASYLSNNIDLPDDYTPLIAFALTFVVIVVGVHFLARLIQKLVKLVALNLVNRIAGAIFSGLKTALILSFILFFIESVDQSIKVIPKDKKDQSLLYYPLSGIAFSIIPSITNSEYFEVLEKEYQNMKSGFPDFNLQ
ncbi:MAG: CvpA family protein [Bacteroidetes bacterium]|nr:MAG: CvpA family protein [Bacteroidota bacterium]